MQRFAFLFAIALATPAAASSWDIDTAHSMAGFVAKHLVFTKVHGRFNTWSGTVTLDDKDITKSKVDVKIDASSINTENEKRDAHLKSPDFFDVAKFKDITFKSTKIEKGADAGTLKVTGDLTIHGVTKPITLDVSGPSQEFKDPGGNAHVAFSATGKVNRKDFGLNWSTAVEAGPVVSDEIALEIEIELFHKH
jgi:polyisoprenoid-binding protein YceI